MVSYPSSRWKGMGSVVIVGLPAVADGLDDGLRAGHVVARGVDARIGGAVVLAHFHGAPVQLDAEVLGHEVVQRRLTEGPNDHVAIDHELAALNRHGRTPA